MEFDGEFCQEIKLLVDCFLPYFAKLGKSVEKMIHQKKNRGHRTSKIVRPMHKEPSDPFRI